jgi:hypothetical protein
VHRLLALLVGLVLIVGTIAGCGSGSAPVIATFTRTWQDGRVEKLELYDDGRVLMDHAGYLERLTLSEADTAILRSSLGSIQPTADPSAYPRLELTPTAGAPVAVAVDPGTTGALFLSLLDHHRLS